MAESITGYELPKSPQKQEGHTQEQLQEIKNQYLETKHDINHPAHNPNAATHMKEKLKYEQQMETLIYAGLL